MKKQVINTFFIAILTTLSGCSVVGGIFKAGMGVGIFVVVIVIGIVIYLITRIGKNR